MAKAKIEIVLCACGCGVKTPLAKRTDNRWGQIKGQPVRYLRGHHSRGKPKSEEHKAKLSVAMKGHPGYWKGKKIPLWARVKMSISARKKVFSAEHRKHLGEAVRKRIVTEKTREKLRNHRHSFETRKRMSEAQKGPKGSNWQGGISSINERTRLSIVFREWRKAVFTRDGFVCQICGAKHEKGRRPILHPHHIKPFAEYPELRFDVNNGITLCKECHLDIHKKKVG